MTPSCDDSAPDPFVLAHRFVERRYRDGEIAWLWVKTYALRDTDVDCTGITDDQLAARIEVAKGG